MTTIVIGIGTDEEILRRLVSHGIAVVDIRDIAAPILVDADRVWLDELATLTKMELPPAIEYEAPRDNRAQWKREKNRHRRSW
jgi:hypothetical protein